MLSSLRNASGNVFVKVLLLLLALSFAAWGVGDMFRGGGAQLAAEAGEKPITEQAVQSALQEQVNSFRQLFGGNISTDLIMSLGLYQQALDRLVNGAILEQEMVRLNVAINDNAVKEKIRNDNRFRNPEGAFDRLRFQNVLRQSGFTEKSFTESVRSNLALERFQQIFLEFPLAPTVTAEQLERFKNETRSAVMLEIPETMVTEVGEPDEAALLNFYNDRLDEYKTAEYRNISYISISLSDMKSGSAKLVEEDFYAMANAVEDKLASGATLLEAAVHIGAEVVHIAGMDAGGINQAGETVDTLPDKENFLKTAFATEEGGISSMQVTDSGGYYILQVDKRIPPRVRALDEVRASVRKSWEQQERQRLLQTKADEIAALLKESGDPERVKAVFPALKSRTITVTRQQRSETPETALAAKIFDISEEGLAASVTPPVAFNHKYYLAMLTGIDYPEIEDNMLEITRKQLQDEMRGELMLQYLRHTQKQRYPVKYYKRPAASVDQKD